MNIAGYDNWKLASPPENSMVTACCGCSDYEEDVDVCAECGSTEIGEKSVGDEGWTICDECNAIEQGYEQVILCGKCGDECELIEDYEYEQNEKDNYDEMRWEGDRDEGLI